RLERHELHEADEHDRPQRGQADQHQEAEHAGRDRDAEDQAEDHHQHRDRQLEGAVALPVEELRLGRREDLRRLADVDDQEEQRDEQRRQQRLRRPPALAQRALTQHPGIAHAVTSCTSPATLLRERPVASRNTSSSDGSASSPSRSRSSAFRLAGVPSRTIRPSSMIASRSQSASASSRYCVVRNTVVPCSLIRRTSSQIVSRLEGSRPVVGSSRNSTSGRCTSAEARSSRRFMPPEYPLMRRSADSTRSTSSSS